MNYADEAIHSAINEARTLRDRIKKKKSLQVKGQEKDIIRATALAWFNNHRKLLMTLFSEPELDEIDGTYRVVLLAAHKDSVRSKYVSALKTIFTLLAQLRAANVIKISTAPARAPEYASQDLPPDFAQLVKDPQMKVLLEKRWTECNLCVAAGAPLATIVMVGGFLEGLLLGRVNREINKAPIFTAAAAPRAKEGRTRVLGDWTLQNYIDVAHELKWITVTTKDVGDVLRDYRNYIHPHKELSQQVSLTTPDAALLWLIGKTITRQVLSSVAIAS
ncbi:MAG TPA: hypothetical protein VIH46_01800 [Candidatus Acidoferrales bacterium]